MRIIPNPLGMDRVQKVLLSGPQAVGKQHGLQAFQAHTGPCNYLRIAGKGSEQLQQGEAGIDRAWLTDQVPALLGVKSKKPQRSLLTKH